MPVNRGLRIMKIPFKQLLLYVLCIFNERSEGGEEQKSYRTAEKVEKSGGLSSLTSQIRELQSAGEADHETIPFQKPGL